MKEFQRWNSRFTKGELEAKREEAEEDAARCCITVLEKWPLAHFQPSNFVVAEAVYYAQDVAEWQCFRVSLKGLTTGYKLRNLMSRLLVARHTERLDYDMEVIRVNNYIGALKRGGQLDKELNVVK